MESLSEILQAQTFTVSELTECIKELIEGTFLKITLKGEISNYRPSSSGHVYFTLKDANAAISAVLFKGKALRLQFTPKDGMVVTVTGSLSVYAQRGSYQIVVDTMEESGEGNILQILEERKKRLAAEGLFDSAKKVPLPSYPKTVGVVTSPTGAALRDIAQIIQRRNKGISIIIFPCSVQGEDAAKQIAQQIRTANTLCCTDVLIVGRGGGSLEDLLPFSEEIVVRAVAESAIPIVSAVGHEIDWALSDYAADVRAPTPSAAAELVTPLQEDLLNRLQQYQQILQTELENKLEKMKLLVKSFSLESLELRFRTIEQPLLQEFDAAKEDLLLAMQEKIAATREIIKEAVYALNAGNPKGILKRGYAMIRDKETKKIITSHTQTKVGNTLEIIPAEGIITAQITEITR
ncbi:MAG: exodeoxyribonuclease VII large subunit [Spirochaetaceae bacterium]|nr:exodeoxyribonuclease VII large subunit [Spirochaetaceae bacterium]